jgi:hypothetical protein
MGEAKANTNSFDRVVVKLPLTGLAMLAEVELELATSNEPAPFERYSWATNWMEVAVFVRSWQVTVFAPPIAFIV